MVDSHKATQRNFMETQNAHRRKQRELFLLERFFDATKLPAIIVEERERPDFIIQLDGRLIGVEITELFIAHSANSNTMQAQESISTRIVSAAQKFYKDSGAPPAHVSVCFGPGQDLRKLNRDETAKALASFVQSLNLSLWQRADWSPEECDEPLPQEISFVHALGVPSFDMAHWGVARSGWVAQLSVMPLQSRVDEKAKRLPSYKNSIEENWLVVIADATKPSQLIEAKKDFNPSAISSPFARTFFYRHPDSTVIELGNLKRQAKLDDETNEQ